MRLLPWDDQVLEGILGNYIIYLSFFFYDWSGKRMSVLHFMAENL